MSTLSQAEQEAIRAAQQQWLAEHQVNRCPTHAQSTGTSRFSYATRKQRAKEEEVAAEKMAEVRGGDIYNREMGFQQEAQNEARGRNG
jgi:hypothetical protein